MKKQDCRAWWLYDVLSRLRTRQGGNIRQAYAHAFQLPSDDLQSVSKALIEVRDLLEILESDLKQIDGINHQFFLRPFPKARDILSLENLGEGWGHAGRFPEESLAEFRFVADELSKHKPEVRIPEEDIRAFSAEIASLFEKVTASGLPKSLKSTILDLLTVARNAIDSYRIRGSRAMREAVSLAVGEMLRHQEEIKANSGEPALQQFLKLISKIDSLATKVEPYAKAIETALPYLLNMSGSA